ncbi:glutathione-S-transferase/glutaredoxin [Trypanosoma grayi]|uniref:glutathione-S-transferase/glutaredoxin n=1 Tax=Trypanosoma grayi TaxID=71804 RepID=UPI0004F495B8|nr:glutathione-S-transferase/glutaredoxin [Trypanosoma grayi]KEG09540.1 glutathione-S-transferase/glutaredoxin [Trypanosoma grayi]
MRWGARRVFIAAAGGAAVVGGATLWYATRGEATKSKSPPQLSAEQFNALQERDLLAEALRTTHLPWTGRGIQREGSRQSDGRDFTMTLYRLLGCPYCAKVEWMLCYHSVPFNTVDVDTLTGAGIPDPRYTLVPQIRLAPVDDASRSNVSNGNITTTHAPQENGVYVVDSQQIISTLSVPLGFAAQLQDPRVLETRQWIQDRFQAVSFIAINKTWSNAFASYPYVTPPQYHNIIFRVVGASVLHMLSRYKIQPNLMAHETSASATPPKDAAVWLEKELSVFISHVQAAHSQQHFHGGKEPDIADVEMYAVTRVVDKHPKLRHVLHQGAIGEWNAAMDAEMEKRMHMKR